MSNHMPTEEQTKGVTVKVIEGTVTENAGIWCNDQLQTHYPSSHSVLYGLKGKRIRMTIEVIED